MSPNVAWITWQYSSPWSNDWQTTANNFWFTLMHANTFKKTVVDRQSSLHLRDTLHNNSHVICRLKIVHPGVSAMEFSKWAQLVYHYQCEYSPNDVPPPKSCFSLMMFPKWPSMMFPKGGSTFKFPSRWFLKFMFEMDSSMVCQTEGSLSVWMFLKWGSSNRIMFLSNDVPQIAFHDVPQSGFPSVPVNGVQWGSFNQIMFLPNDVL